MKNLMFVQFSHSGFEHQLTTQEMTNFIGTTMLKDWNYGMHKRKFMKCLGCVIDKDLKSSFAELYFWGEWEPMSYVKVLDYAADGHTLPRYLHEPVLILKSNGKPISPWYRNVRCTQAINDGQNKNRALCQNTDPYIFSDNFLFSCCRQVKKNKPTILQNLAPGSIILFGSSFNTKTDPIFAIDTVFVIGKSRKYYPRNSQTDLKGFVPNEYYTVMGFEKWPDMPFTCYQGVSYQECPNGPFSFVPCKTELPFDGEKSIGFKRPFVRYCDLEYNGKKMINPSNTRSFCTQFIVSEADAIELWNKVKDIILSQGFSLGVQFRYHTKVY